MGKILLVEPDEMLIPVLGEILTIMGNSYSPARTAFEGLKLLQKRKFDAVIIDISKRLEPGEKIIQEIAKQPDPVPVIAIASDLAVVKPHPIVKDVIAKPINTSTLKEVLQKHLSGPQAKLR